MIHHKKFDPFFVSVTRRRVMSVGLRAENFNVCNDLGRTKNCNFTVLDQKYHFLGKLDPTNQNCHFQLKFVTLTTSNMQNSMMVFTFPAFNWIQLEIPFLGKFGPKIKIVHLS